MSLLRIPLVLAVVLFPLVCRAGAASAVTLPDTAVTVRVYDAAPDDRAWAAALPVAERLLNDSGIDVRWVSCDGRHAAQPACTGPLQVNEFVARVVHRASVTAEDTLPLGYALIDARRGAGTLATIYLDRVWQLAWQGHAEPTLIFARTLAHELGHLLLGSNRHSSAGLMRPVWRTAEVRRDRAGDWQFTAADAAAMRRGIEGRAAQQIAGYRAGLE